MSAYIHDGYTEDGYLAESKRMYAALRFQYRPMLIAERTHVLALIEKREPRGQDAVRAEALKSHLVSWDLHHDGQPVPIEASHLLRLQPSLFLALWYVVTGIAAPDEDPDKMTADNGLTGQSKMEADLKN